MDEYLEELIRSQRSGQAKAPEPGTAERGSYSDNKLLDSILDLEFAQVNELGIDVQLDLVGLPAELPYREASMASMLMNLLDNAINANAAVSDQSQRWLRLEMQYEEKTGLALRCANATNDTAADEPQPMRRGHGYGTGIIAGLVDELEGSYGVSTGDGCYRVDIKLPPVPGSG
jgi:sensor histidine kinase regulating citrate/malate metabolism